MFSRRSWLRSAITLVSTLSLFGVKAANGFCRVIKIRRLDSPGVRMKDPCIEFLERHHKLGFYVLQSDITTERWRELSNGHYIFYALYSGSWYFIDHGFIVGPYTPMLNPPKTEKFYTCLLQRHEIKQGRCYTKHKRQAKELHVREEEKKK